AGRTVINSLLSKSAELESELLQFISLPPFDRSERIVASRVMCSIAFEHAESAKLLIATGNFTSATGLVRLQYEALTRAMWLLYSASDHAISKLMCELTNESAEKANKLPMLSEMLKSLEGKAPQEALDMLLEFKEYSWKPLSSFIHGGIHAINRHSKGYPAPLLIQMLKISTSVSVMVRRLLVILSVFLRRRVKIPAIHKQYEHCLPKYNSDCSQQLVQAARFTCSGQAKVSPLTKR